MRPVYVFEKTEHLLVFSRCLFASDAPTSFIAAVGNLPGLAGGMDEPNYPEGLPVGC
jgi:hypothetical protein